MSIKGQSENEVSDRNNVIKSIKVTRKLPDGIYIRGTVQGYPLLFTADTGASKTIISTRMFEAMEPDDRPILTKTSKLVGASGVSILERGKGMFVIKLGPVEMQVEAIVAEIDDDGLLGVDILQNGRYGPTDLLMSKGILEINKKEVPIIQVGVANRVRKVTAADHFIIPAQSECVIDVFLERQEYDDFSCETDYMVEPTKHFKEQYPLQMANTLVNLNEASTSKVRILNPFPTAISIKQDAVIGSAEPIDGVPLVISSKEDINEEENQTMVRRVKFFSEGTQPPISNITVRKTQVANPEVPSHLTTLYNETTKELSDNQKQRVAQLLHRFKDSFSRDEWDLGLTHLTSHAIKTEGAEPVKQPPRRVPMAYAADEKKAIEDLMAKGVIRESTSPWASPIVLVKKKDGGVRPCVDYRKVNELVKPDGFPLPRIQDCLDAVAGSQLFSTFDLTSGYFQIPLKQEDIPKSAFVCKYGHFEMTRMPFGLNNAASTFQRTMEMALRGLQWITCLIYIDDVIVFGKTFEEHLARVEEVLERIQAAGLKLKPEKCRMLQKEVVFLGHVVSGKGVQPSPTNISKIISWPRPKTAKQVKQFVAMGSYYRRYVKDFASMVRPMVDLTKKGKKFVWSVACETAFAEMKKALLSTDIMGYPLNEGGEFILDVDASDIGIGGILHQFQGDHEKVIAYASRSLNKAERNYCITEKELLAVRYFIEYFRQYLLGRRFRVRSDHQALVWLFRLKEPRGKIARWLEILSQYDFAIEYRPGKKQGHCDALSRCENPKDCECPNQDTSEPLKCGPCKKCVKRAQEMMHSELYKEIITAQEEQTHITGSNSEEMIGVKCLKEKPKPGPSSQGASHPSEPQRSNLLTFWANTRSAEDLQKLQREDSDIGPIINAKLKDKRPTSQDMVTCSPATRHYWILWDLLVIQDGILMKKFLKHDGTGEFLQFVVPTSLKKEILFQMHDSLVSGHLGRKKTKEKILQRFYWYSLKDDVNLYIQRCDTCAADKKPAKTPRAPMGSLRVGAPGDRIATDYLGPFPVTDRGHRYILLFTDHFTKNVEIVPVCDMSAEVCAQKLLNEVISRWGCPLAIHSDQGRTFESKIFQELCRLLEVRKTRTSVRNPRGNGQVERFNRTLLRMIKAYLCGEQKDWDLHLGCLARAYRATPNESTKMTPHLLTIGREVRLPAELVFGSTISSNGEKITSYGDYVDTLRTKIQRAHEIARNHMSASAKRSKDLYDSKVAFNKFNQGDIVWCLMETRKVGISPKPEHVYEGPFLIKRKLSEIDFVLQLDRTGTERPVHHNKLKPYEGVQPPRWIVRAKKQFETQNNQ